MKFAVRIFALAVVAAAAIAGYSTPRSSSVLPNHQTATATPAPMCNPFTEKCPPIRNQ
jgi:hypothetical protein